MCFKNWNKKIKNNISPNKLFLQSMKQYFCSIHLENMQKYFSIFQNQFVHVLCFTFTCFKIMVYYISSFPAKYLVCSKMKILFKIKMEKSVSSWFVLAQLLGIYIVKRNHHQCWKIKVNHVKKAITYIYFYYFVPSAICTLQLFILYFLP